MKNYNQLLLDCVNQSHPRQIGRYYASEIYQIIKGYLQPKNFFTSKPIDLTGAKNILRGEAYETQFKEVLEANKIKFRYGDEIKREIQLTEEVVLVVKPDFEFEDFVIETKYPTTSITTIPEKWEYQLEAEYRATNKKVYLGIFSDPFNLTLYPFKPDERRWLKIQQNLLAFHEKLKQLALANFFDKDLDKNLDKDLQIKKKDKVKR